ncbi:794177a3-faf6-4acf-884e-1dd068ed3ed0 [Sclerotinia trifoliorum]|uniref:794177a3-faf6-4acf-884e-1dd068ed3ed0 n=1 Tax=Sclerotinia trifoliorum TaxID=28548 RepID=A0A8H2W034_9HELO|nr:794177a3-faf6-4acf-884e-1dd068ed3ed0 [Sclerotinia trifoliorum]
MVPSFSEPSDAEMMLIGKGLEELLSNLPGVGETVDTSLLLDKLCFEMSYQWAFGDCSNVVSEKGSLDSGDDTGTVHAAFHSSQAWVGPRIIFGAIARLIPHKKWETTNHIVHDFVERRIDVAMKEVSQSQTREGNEHSTKPASLVESLVKQTSNRHDGNNSKQRTFPSIQKSVRVEASQKRKFKFKRFIDSKSSETEFTSPEYYQRKYENQTVPKHTQTTSYTGPLSLSPVSKRAQLRSCLKLSTPWRLPSPTHSSLCETQQSLIN